MLSQRALEAFNHVLECGSISGAAEVMHVSQPAVSRLIKDLEEQIGFQLFTRFGGKIVPTSEAHELALEVERSFIGIASIEQTARDIKNGQRGSVSIAAMPALSHSMVPDALVELINRRPDFRVSLHSMRTHSVVRQVATRQCQLGFSSPTYHEHDVDRLTTISVPYVCILPQGHPLAEKERISFKDFAGQRVVGYAENTATGALLERAFSTLDNPPRVFARTQLSSIVSGLVLRGLGISIVDKFCVKGHVLQGGVARELDSDEKFRFTIIKPRGQTLGSDLECLLDIFYEQNKHFIS